MNLPERIVLPGKPVTANAGYAPGGRWMRLSDAGKAWKELIKYAVLAQRVQPPQNWRKVHCELVITQYMVDPLAQDTTGGLKLSEDAVMEALTGLDNRHNHDRYVDRAAIERRQADHDYTEVVVKETT